MAEMKFAPIRVRTGSITKGSAPEMVYGRDELVHAFWRSLHRGSLLVLSERRMGKTWFLQLAQARCPDDFAALFLDVEGYHTEKEFVLELNRTVHSSGLIPEERLGEKWVERGRRIAQQWKGTRTKFADVPEVETLGDLLESTCLDFVEAVGSRVTVVIIDEFPLLIDNLFKQEGIRPATELLDRLRAIRQRNPRLRMVFCGSLGMHIVLAKLHQEKYTGQPVNDMDPFEVPPLSVVDATLLAGGLLLGETVACWNLEEAAEAVASAASCVPYYVHQLVAHLANHGKALQSCRDIENALEDLFQAPGDPGQFSYYEARLGQYYSEDTRDAACTALDVLSHAANGLTFDEWLNRVHHHPRLIGMESGAFLRLVRILRDDHYVVQQSERWGFKLEIVRRWWFKTRGGLSS